MKRRFVNALVFGALLIAPASTFVSCSDYDDDISSLRNDLNETNANLQSLVDGRITTIENEIGNLKTADENLSAAIEEAKGLIENGDAATLAGARQLVDDAKASLEQALKDSVGNLTKRDAELQLAIIDAQTKADQAYDLATEVKATAEAAAQTANENKEALEALATKLDGVEGNLADILEGLEQQITTLSQNMQEAQADISRIDGALSAQQATLDQLQEWKGTADADIKQALADIDQLQADLKQQKADLQKYVDDAVAAVEGNVDALSSTVEEIQKTYAAADADLQGQITGLNTSLTDLNTTVDGLETRIGDLEKKLGESINVLQTLLKNALRGLVFSPEMYVDGIEAQEYAYSTFNPLVAVANPTPSGTNPDGKNFTITSANSGATTWAYKDGTNSVTINPVTTLTYHMNPSSASVAFGDLSFFSKDVQVITRAAGANPRTAENDLAGNKVFSCNGGLLKVGVVADGPSIEKSDATILALQAKVNKDGQDTLITSDYAMLYGTQVTFQGIAFNDGTEAVECAGTEDELYGGAVKAVEEEATHKILYTEYGDNAGLNLKNLLVLHYKHDTKSDKKADHAVMSLADAAKYGLSVDFKLIDYQVGDNKTSDSKYATIDETTGVLKTRTVDEKGNTIVPGDDNLAAPAIGREPLIRVRVMQGNNVVLYGFIKVEIVQKAPEALEDVVAGVFDGGSTGADPCGNNNSVKTTWSWTSANILGKLGLDIAEFHDRYKLELADGKAVQYVSADGKTFTPAGNNAIGQVTEVQESAGSVTTVLLWETSSDDRQTIWEATGHTGTIYVKYAPNDPEHDPAVYVGISQSITKQAAGSISQKTPEYWSGNSVLLNVNYPLDGSKVSDFAFANDLDNAWVDKTVKFSRKDVTAYKYFFNPSMTEIAGEAVTVVNDYGNNRTTVNTNAGWKAWNTDTEMNYQTKYDEGVYTMNHIYLAGHAGDETYLIASLDQSTGVITYAKNDNAKRLLNKDPKAVEVMLGVVGKNSCDLVVPTNDNLFTSIFRRPVNIAQATDIPHFVDAANNGSSVDVFDMLAFTDWRNEAFTGNNGWLFGYYEISKVEMGTKDEITTTLGGGSLSDAKNTLSRYPDIIVKLTGNTPIIVSNCTEANSENIINKVRSQLGKITVINMGMTVSTYQLRIPLTITYAWGQQTVYVDVTVDSTMQSNHK